jgi:surface protein with Ig-like domain
MKKTIYSITCLLALGSVMLISSCSKDDTPPVITVVGDNPATVSLNGTYIDEGATATDDKDGNITASITAIDNVDEDLAGSYTVTYSVSDKEGNNQTATRTVNVVNDAAYLEGTYTTVEGSSSWNQTVTASTTTNNRITFSRFGDYDNNDKIYADVTGSTMSIGSQSANGIGNFGCDHIFTQSGSNLVPIAQISGKWKFSIHFTDQTLQGGSNCNAANNTYEDIFSQQ